MKMMNKALIYSLLLLSLSLTHISHAQVVNKREKSAAYVVNNKSTLEIENKYGNIHLSNWDKDSVKVVMKMVVTAKNKEKLEKTLGDIHFDFKKTGDFITVKTKVDIGTFGQISEELFKSYDDVKINYTVKAPPYLNIRLSNKFGNIYLEKVLGKADINLSHGDLKAKDFEGRLKLEHSFGDADISKVSTAYLNLNYTDLKIKESSFLDISSKSSDILLSNAAKVVIDARRGDIEISKLQTCIAKTTFADIQIGLLTKEINVEMQYGNLLLERTIADFSLINIQSKYTDTDMYFDYGTSFDFDMTYRKVDFTYSKSNASLETKSLENASKKDYLNTYGLFGTSANTNSRVRINAENGDFKITYH